jgi:ABC-type polysaccharide/polyol phosphate transport system ATPase subunit
MPSIELNGVSVCYRLPRGGTRSIKELVLNWLRGAVVFDEFLALRDVRLSIQAGERLGVVGRNGAGKSTLLQVIARVSTPTSGTAVVHGRVAPLLQLGTGFDTELTGRENIFLNGALLGLSRAEITERYDAIVDFAELRDFIDVPLRAYSSGMMARLGFAVATAVRPDILLLDEILSVGDEEFQKKCVNHMRNYAHEGTTLVLVSHNANDILAQCTRAIWLESGQILADGVPADVIGAYRAHHAPELIAAD